MVLLSRAQAWMDRVPVVEGMVLIGLSILYILVVWSQMASGR